MNKIYKILILGLILLVYTVSAEQVVSTKQTDLICVDKVTTESPPPIPSFIKINKSVEKKDLCPEGKVPKIREDNIYDNATNIISKDTDRYINSDISTSCINNMCIDRVESYQYVDTKVKGIYAYISQHDPEIDPINGYYSSAGISIYHNLDNNYITVGWRKESGDKTRLFVSRYYNSYRPGGYSEEGWVQYSNKYYPGMILDSSGSSKLYLIFYAQGNILSGTGNWWIIYDNEWVGYYPESLWPSGYFNEGNTITYFGKVVSKTPVTITDMGNGLWPDKWPESYWAATISQQHYWDKKYDDWSSANTQKFSSNTQLYRIVPASQWLQNDMRYGGPGGYIFAAAPNGGERWARGTIKTIKWTYNGQIGTNVRIDLLKGGILNRVITYSTPIGSSGSGYYSWKIPSIQALGSNYKIKITSTSNSVFKDTSDNNFIIGGINVTSPNGGEYWQRGTTKTIKWSSLGNAGGYVTIDLYRAGVFKRKIVSSTPNDGYYSWTISPTQELGSDYKVKITSTSNSAYTDMSNNNFRIY